MISTIAMDTKLMEHKKHSANCLTYFTLKCFSGWVSMFLSSDKNRPVYLKSHVKDHEPPISHKATDLQFVDICNLLLCMTCNLEPSVWAGKHHYMQASEQQTSPNQLCLGEIHPCYSENKDTGETKQSGRTPIHLMVRSVKKHAQDSDSTHCLCWAYHKLLDACIRKSRTRMRNSLCT